MPTNTQNFSNKRIAKNTLIVYTRLFFVSIIGLFTSRYVLQALGVSDFGLYNVVGSLLAILSFLSGSLTTTTTRFINIEEGKEDGNTNKIFNACLLIHIVVAAILLILAETIGIFYIRNYLNVSKGMEGPAMFVFQVSIVVACLGLINIPYQGLLMAKEKFSVIAVVEIINCIIKFILVLLLFIFANDRLQVYAIFMSFTTLISFIAFHWYCYSKWKHIIKKKLTIKNTNIKEVLKFNNYNLLSSLSLTIRDQGSNMLINYFFGT
ncbi:MAG: oligosaccharide flippase family protein, partial [Bacilli bacterium]|nr:oligosaccharide flippase family protein [Bacilli bacterium]